MPTPTAYLVLTALPHNRPPLGILPAPLGQTFALTAGKNSIGRIAPPHPNAAEVPLPWVFVSRYHAQIDYVDRVGWQIIDLRSRNGTFVNGQAVQSQIATPLADGDRVGIGKLPDNLELQFCLHLAPATPPSNDADCEDTRAGEERTEPHPMY